MCHKEDGGNSIMWYDIHDINSRLFTVSVSEPEGYGETCESLIWGVLVTGSPTRGFSLRTKYSGAGKLCLSLYLTIAEMTFIT